MIVHLASALDMQTRCGLPIDESLNLTIRQRRVTCPRCAQPARTHAESIAIGAARRGNTWSTCR